MALSIEARQIINILDEEGFGFLAGVILTEISLGRAIDSDGDEDAPRETIPDEGQLEEIIRMLQQRLVAPVRGLAEAEQIAGNIQGTSPVRIGFIDEDGNEIQRSESPLTAGDSGIADKLDDLLRRISQMIDPDLTTRT